ncbi:MAG TPA: hypothetical protein VMW34_02780 [Anaerolineales bacterium]|nr:hypothetical protein [Anaerolineales bacterium]
MFTWKDYYLEFERRQDQIAEAEHDRLVKLYSNVKKFSLRIFKDRVSLMYFTTAKEAK